MVSYPLQGHVRNSFQATIVNRQADSLMTSAPYIHTFHSGFLSFYFSIFVKMQNLRNFYQVSHTFRLERWSNRIASFDRWWTTIQNHQDTIVGGPNNRPKTIEHDGFPQLFHSILMFALKTIEEWRW